MRPKSATLLALFGLLTAGCAATAAAPSPPPYHTHATQTAAPAPAPAAKPAGSPQLVAFSMFAGGMGWGVASTSPGAGPPGCACGELLWRTQDAGARWMTVEAPSFQAAVFPGPQKAVLAAFDQAAHTVTISLKTAASAPWQTRQILLPSWTASPNYQVVPSIAIHDGSIWLGAVAYFAGMSFSVLPKGTLFFRSSDQGLHWSPVPMPPNALDALPDVFTEIRFAGGIANSAASQPGVLPQQGPLQISISYDGGLAWRQATLPVPRVAAGEGMQVVPPVALGGDNALMAIELGGRQRGAAKLLLYGTRDGGQSWALRSTLRGLPTRALPLLDFPGGPTGWLADGAAIYQTSDGGQSWHALGLAGPAQYTVLQLSLQQGAGIVALLSDGTLWMRDGGQWRQEYP